MEKISKEVNSLICLGEITSPHGLNGQVCVRSFTRPPENLFVYGTLCDSNGNKFLPNKINIVSNKMIVQFDNISNRNDAESIRGTRLFIERQKLPDPKNNEFYHADLIGLNVENKDGRLVGRVAAIQNFGAGDLLDIQLQNGESELIPFTSTHVEEIDIKKKQIIIDENFISLSTQNSVELEVDL